MANRGRASHTGLVLQVGGVALNSYGGIIRIPVVQLNPQLEPDGIGLPGFVNCKTTGQACEDLLDFY